MSEYMPDFSLKKMPEIVRIYVSWWGVIKKRKILDMKIHHSKIKISDMIQIIGSSIFKEKKI